MITTYHGTNTYLANKAIRERIAKLNEMNVTDLDTPTLEELKNAVNVSPLFATRRIIIVRSLENLDKDNKLVIGVLENKRPSSHVIFVIKEYGKIYERLATYLKKSQIIKINQFNIVAAKKYTEQEAKKRELTFTKDNLDYFLFWVGHTPEAIDIELSNLNKPHIKKVSMDDIRTHVNRRTETKVFTITENIFAKPIDETLTKLEQYLTEKPDNINAFINILISDLKLAIIIKAEKDITGKMEVSPYRVRVIRGKTKQYTLSQLTTFFCDMNRTIYEGQRQSINPLPVIYEAFFRFRHA